MSQRGIFHPADVVADGVMRAGFGHEHAVARPQPFDNECPFDKLPQVAFLPGKEDRERRHRYFGRRIGRDFQERLRVGHHQGRRAVQAAQRLAKLALLDNQAVGVAVLPIKELGCASLSHQLKDDCSMDTKVLM